MPQISVIMPVYRSAARMRPCVDSVLAQTFTDFELILVDDCSPDHESRDLCDEYAAKDSRIKVLHLSENHGIAGARNVGLRNACGTYIQFMDADDYAAPEMLMDMRALILSSNTDLVCAPVKMTNVMTQIETQTSIIPIASTSAPTLWDDIRRLNKIGVFHSVWNKLYKNEVIKKNHIAFDARIITADDRAFNFSYLQHIHALCTTERAYYNWFQWSTAQASNFRQTERSLDALFETFLSLFVHFKAEKRQDKQCFSDEFYPTLSYLFGTASSAPFQTAFSAARLMKKYKKMLVFPRDRSHFKIYMMSILLWFHLSFLLGVLTAICYLFKRRKQHA